MIPTFWPSISTTTDFFTFELSWFDSMFEVTTGKFASRVINDVRANKSSYLALICYQNFTFQKWNKPFNSIIEFMIAEAHSSEIYHIGKLDHCFELEQRVPNCTLIKVTSVQDNSVFRILVTNFFHFRINPGYPSIAFVCEWFIWRKAKLLADGTFKWSFDAPDSKAIRI